ncbi:WD40-repeat-containing domain protein [Vararia minispora EC-137]|uniref:WD40-repeat-containing domain protein n=1 Tax=Vararia minispora EC-137 TaxID=1314806 RepID=A0ACB8QID4_9AGAM|nr:WD40-repeat-containing domain protein [Vararia minispora EC-137]
MTARVFRHNANQILIQTAPLPRPSVSRHTVLWPRSASHKLALYIPTPPDPSLCASKHLMIRYTEVKTLGEMHTASINCVSFSPNGRYFASGADDCFLNVFSTGTAKRIRRYQGSCSIQAIVWDDRFPNTVIAGDQSGDVHILSLRIATVLRPKARDHLVVEHVFGCVHAMAVRGAFLAISSGNTTDAWNSQIVFDPPPPFSNVIASFSEPLATAVQFVSDDTLLVAYLEHGLIYVLVLAAYGTTIAVSNLYDGLDWYTVQDPSFLRPETPIQHTCTTQMRVPSLLNASLPVKFIENGTFVVVGGWNGIAHIIGVVGGQSHQTLDHHGGVIQALDSFSRGRTRWIVTATSSTSSPELKVWKAVAKRTLPFRSCWSFMHKYLLPYLSVVRLGLSLPKHWKWRFVAIPSNTRRTIMNLVNNVTRIFAREANRYTLSNAAAGMVISVHMRGDYVPRAVKFRREQWTWKTRAAFVICAWLDASASPLEKRGD